MRREWRASAIASLPAALLLSFLLLPSTCTSIFATFQCVGFRHSDGPPTETRFYLAADLSLSCADSEPEYAQARSVAYVLIGLWPVGVPLMYMALLWGSRAAILRQSHPTKLSRAASFLYDDYRPQFFWWEPFEMVRKLTLTGFILLVPDQATQGCVMLPIATVPWLPCLLTLSSCSVIPAFEFDRRVLLALSLSLAWLTLHLLCSPFRRAEDNWLMTLMQLGLVLVYLTVMVLKVGSRPAFR